MPKSEAPKSERSPKAEIRIAARQSVFRTSGFGLRPSFGFRSSDFGLGGDSCDSLYLFSYIGRFRLLLTPLSKVFVLKDSVGQQLIALR
jgi:hypothetical protein